MKGPAIRVPRLQRVTAFLNWALLAICAAVLILNTVQACGPYLSLRPYLTRSFWLPMFFTSKHLLPSDKPANMTPYAGFSSEDVPAALADLRRAYMPLAITMKQDQPIFEEASRAAERALAPGVLTGKYLEEARLIDCKVALRWAEGNPGTCEAAKQKLEAFLSFAENRAFASEARGWLARIFYLQKDYVRAALIYLDETDATDSPLNRTTLETSLRWVYSDGLLQIRERAEEFFDTPRHALFLVNLITNRSGYHAANQDTELGGKVLALLQSHPRLFQSSTDADALTLALMRTSIYMGDLATASKYAASASKSGALLQNPEFNWMSAIARFLQHDFAGAEEPLLRMLNSPSSSQEDRATAAQALVGVYFKTGRHVDALHAAFIQQSSSSQAHLGPDIISPRLQWCSYCQDLELPYLLDICLSDEELRAYLNKYPDPVGPNVLTGSYDHPRYFSAPQIVQYSLAVRLARREEYVQAAIIFADLSVTERAEKMKYLADLVAHFKDPARPASERLAARFDYADYLASNPDRLYFNDLLWFRMQVSVFREQYYDGALWRNSPRMQPGWTRIERDTILADDRKLRDQQEERWKAFHILEQVAREAGFTELGRKSATKIIECLRAIRTDRFGRAQEINTAISTWTRWLSVKSANPQP